MTLHFGTDWAQCKPDQDELKESGYGISAVALMSEVVGNFRACAEETR